MSTPAAIQYARITTQDLPASDYIPAVRDVLGRDTMGIDLRPMDGDMRSLESFHYHAHVGLLSPQAGYLHSEHTPIHMRRTAALMSDGLDDIFLTATYGETGGCIVREGGRDVAVPAGGIVLLSKARVHDGIIPWAATTVGLQVPRAALTRLLPGLEEAPMHILHPGAPGTESAALALSYAGLLARQGSLSGAPLASAVAHLHDLMAAAIDARWAASLQEPGHDAGDAPRLALIQHSIHARLGEPGLTLDAIARQHHTTPRQVQRLFARQGTSFSDFVREARMQRALALLTSPRERHRRVLQVALDCGFDDIPAFSRAFRRRFGMTPSEAREAG
ncbi:AraC family transcriptional regulator [Acidovorax sp. MR-S7]|uniref:helix-turn-helix transcriptional regulator n=1 Tax=Acidovorax sp. MR-S7 TaxID=1268622 RepID=UPI00035DDA51|nr:AraC family transcriptional regulator [Acidovorax sp. MR-S7]GAD24094.1 hypothetical protein AVS7_03854 [Acidovorax sp. MR-S7]